MCGIHGEFFCSSGLSKEEDFRNRNNLNLKRGPNQEGFWSNQRNCSLGFRRLAIIDLSDSGSQPMKSLKDRFMMVFNGEIYNYLDIKDDLITNGYSFKGKSDSEVLVNSFECFGIESTLKRIDGMFAIALYDLVEDCIYLIRDFAGIKPLYYGNSNGNLVFGSRYDQISKHPLFKEESINTSALSDYLRFQYVPAPKGILNNTYQVLPGEIVKIDKNGYFDHSRYWSFPKMDASITKKNVPDFQELIFSSLTEIVDCTDVGIGCFLSGGIDSPIVAALAKESKPDLQTYSLGSDSQVHDESDMALKYAKSIGTTNHLEKMNAQTCLEILEDAMNELGEPFADISMLPTYLLSKNASKDQKVIISGDGGDELFFGYERFSSVFKNKKWNWIPNELRYLAYGTDRVLFSNDHINECILSPSLSMAHQGLHQRFNDSDILKVFPNLQMEDFNTLPFYTEEDSKDDDEFLQNMREAEFQGMMQKTLSKVDKMSMANSLEVRIPFLRKDILEMAFKTPPSLLYDPNKKKPVLKNILRKLTPDVSFDNKKRGFSVPLGKWIREDLKSSFKEAIFSTNFIETFNLDKDELDIIWSEHMDQIRDRKFELFTLYSLQKWLQNQKR